MSFRSLPFDFLNLLIYRGMCPLKNSTWLANPADIQTELFYSARGIDEEPLDQLGHEVNSAAPFRRKVRSCVNVSVSHDFDRHTRPFNVNTTFIRVQQVLKEGVTWEAAGAFDWMMERIRMEGEFDGCRTLEEVKTRFGRLDDLIEDFRRGRGISTPMQGRCLSVIRRYLGEDSIAVAVGRSGELIFCGRGTHRLAIAQLLNAPAIPVSLCAVHRDSISGLHWRKNLRPLAIDRHA